MRNDDDANGKHGEPGTTFALTPVGAFDLRESALFGFGQTVDAETAEGAFDGVMRMAFCLDGGYERQVGVELRHAGARVNGLVHGAAAPAVVAAQTARILSLDHDARAFAEVGRRDPVIRRLQLAAPGLRPPLFHSPYEAAAWSVLSARRPAAQMKRVRSLLSQAAGRSFVLAGRPVAAFPTPEQVLRVAAFPGIDAERLTRLHGVARAAAAGLLESERLRRLGPEDALQDVQRIKGIGPVYASLIVIRAVGFTDVLPVDEPRVRALIGRLYSFDAPVTAAEFTGIAEPWRPWRTWASVYVRAVGPRVLAGAERRSA